MLFVMGVGFLLDSPLIVFHSMCVFRLWSQCPSRCSFHMPDLCVCMAWLISLFKCSSLLSVGSFALIMSRSFICALMFSGSRGLLGLILPFGMPYYPSCSESTFFIRPFHTELKSSQSHLRRYCVLSPFSSLHAVHRISVMIPLPLPHQSHSAAPFTVVGLRPVPQTAFPHLFCVLPLSFHPSRHP